MSLGKGTIGWWGGMIWMRITGMMVLALWLWGEVTCLVKGLEVRFRYMGRIEENFGNMCLGN